MFSSVRFRLLSLAGLGFVAIMMLAGTTFVELRMLGELHDATYVRAQNASRAMEASRMGAQLYRIVADAVINRDLGAARQDFAAARTEAFGDMDELARIADTAAEKASVARARAGIEGIVALFETRLLPLLSDPAASNEAIRDVDGRIDEHVKDIREALKSVAASTLVEADKANQGFDERRSEITLIAVIVGLLTAILLAGFSIRIAGSIIASLRRAQDVTHRIASGDLSGTVDVVGKDEFADLLRSAAAMHTGLRDIVSQLQQGAGKIATMSEALASTTGQISAATDTQAQSASAMAANVEQMSVSITHVSDRASDVRSASIRSGEVSRQGSTVIDELLEGNHGTANAVESAAARIQDLSRVSGEISSIVMVISEVADQTNLLALNAAIEAARAGEQGRGFAVVADEVRKLAERTGQSTQDISRMIAEIQTVTREVVGNMASAVQKVRAGEALSQQARATIGEIGEQSGSVVLAVEEITDALREQSAASNDIARRVEQIAVSSEQNCVAVRSTAESARQLEAVSASLNEATARFRLN